MTGEVFLQASEDEIRVTVEKLCKASKQRPRVQDQWKTMFMDEYMHEFLSVRAMVRKGSYEENRAGDDSILFSDLDVNPAFHSSGSHFPLQSTHNKIFSWNQRRLVTPGECFSAQGVDWYFVLSGGRGTSPIRDIASSLSDGQQRMLSGNALCLSSFATFLLFCLCHTQWRDDLQQLPARIACPDSDTDSD